MEKSKAEWEYNQLLKSGMFWEFYPNLSGEWEQDEEQWLEIYEELTNLRGK